MIARDVLARRAVTEALRLRRRHGRSLEDPICPIDLALHEGVDVRLEPVSSLEGMYTPDVPAIVLGSLRPRGRRAFTCAHELGHHVFGHGFRIDELLDDGASADATDDAEFAADRFAAALLMPKLAVLHAFDLRSWPIASCTAEQAFIVAGLFGVGYTTLVGYLAGTLHVITRSTSDELRKQAPKATRARIAGRDCPRGLVIVDDWWSGRPVDAEVGDLVLLPAGASASSNVMQHVSGCLFTATAPGAGRVHREAWELPVRVARANYSGLATYRHLEEVDDDV